MNTQNLGHPQDTHLGLSLRPPLLPPPRATGLGPSSMGSRGTEGAAALAFFGIRTIYYSSSKSLCHHENSYAHQKTRVGVTIRVLSQSQRKCTMKRRRSKRWGPNPTKNPTHTISAHAPPTACNRYGSLLKQRRDACTLTTSPTTRRRRPALAPSTPSRSQRAKSETKTIFGRQHGKAFDMLP